MKLVVKKLLHSSVIRILLAQCFSRYILQHSFRVYSERENSKLHRDLFKTKTTVKNQSSKSLQNERSDLIFIINTS